MSRGIKADDKRAAEQRKADDERAAIAKQGRSAADMGPTTREGVINIHVAGAHLTRREAGAAGARAAAAARRARMTPNTEQEAVM